MSRRQDVQSATGEALVFEPFGVFQKFSKSAPVGGEVGYATGCEWWVLGLTGTLNTGIIYTNIGSNGRGTNATATWIETDPSSAGGFQFGGGTGVMLGSGNLAKTVLGTGISPSATGADKILGSYLLPAGSLDAAGRGIQITAMGSFAANGNTKEIKIIAGATNATPVTTDGTVTVTGGTTIGDSGALTTNSGGWSLVAQLFKFGAKGSNTQQSATTGIIAGGVHAGMGAPNLGVTLTEANALLFVVTGNCTTTATDIVFDFMEVTAFN